MQILLLLLLLHSFNGFKTWVSWHQKGKPFWILLEHEMMGWQWHQVDHMQIICTSLQTDNHPSTSLLSFYRPDALPATQPTASKHWRLRQKAVNVSKNSIKINIHSDILLNDKLQESEQKTKKPIVFYITVFIILRIVKQMLHLHRGP